MNHVTLLHTFKNVLYQYGAEGAAQKQQLLKQLSRVPLNVNSDLQEYHEALLFLQAYPDNAAIEKQTWRELNRITAFLRSSSAAQRKKLDESGLPFTGMITRYSPELLSLLEADPECTLELDSFDSAPHSLNRVLQVTLPATEKDFTAAGEKNMELLHTLGLKKNAYLAFILGQVETIADPQVKDMLWQELALFADIRFTAPLFSRTMNRIPDAPVFYHDEIVKRIDFEKLLHTPLPQAVSMDETRRNQLVKIIRRAMVLTMRETDTSTYMQEDTLRYFELDRGISVAVYGMYPERQLPLQSYIGYTLFKNGLPAAYGGGWVFGASAMFGLNILDSFRGGESAFIMGQLLRVYKQLFSLQYIEVEAYQIGKANSDGIKTGAYWFYHRFGFRSVNAALRKLAARDAEKIKRDKTYRSSRKTLLALAESNIALVLDNSRHYMPEDLGRVISKMIVKKYRGMRNIAVQKTVADFTGKLSPADAEKVLRYPHSLAEWALAAEASAISDAQQLKRIANAIVLKATDPYAYNQVVTELLFSGSF